MDKNVYYFDALKKPNKIEVTFENMHMSALALVIYHYIAASSIITKNCQ